MHICVQMYKGERVGPYLSHSYVTVVLFVTVIIYRYILYYKKPLRGHIMDIHFWCHFHFAFLSNSLYRNPLGRGVRPF